MRSFFPSLLLLYYHVHAVTVTVQGPVIHGQNLTATWTRTADEDESYIGVIAPQGVENVTGLPWFRTASQGNLQWTSSFPIFDAEQDGNYHIIATDNSGNPLYSGNVFAVEDQAPPGPGTTSEQKTQSPADPTTTTPTGSSTTKASPTSLTTTSSTTSSSASSSDSQTTSTPTGLGTQISTQQQQQSSTSSSPPDQTSDSPAQLQGGSDSQQSKPPIPIIAGSVIGVIALIALVLLLLFYRRRRRRLQGQNQMVGQKADLLGEGPIPVFRNALASPVSEGPTVAVMDEKRLEDSMNSSTAGESSSASGSGLAAAVFPAAADGMNSRTPAPVGPEPAPTPEVALPTRVLPLPPSSPRPPSAAPTAFTTYTAYSGLPSFSSNLDNQALLSQFHQALAEITRLDSHGAAEELELPTFSEDLPPQDMAAQLQRAMDEILRLRAQLQVRQDEPPAYETPG